MSRRLAQRSLYESLGSRHWPFECQCAVREAAENGKDTTGTSQAQPSAYPVPDRQG